MSTNLATLVSFNQSHICNNVGNTHIQRFILNSLRNWELGNQTYGILRKEQKDYTGNFCPN